MTSSTDEPSYESAPDTAHASVIEDHPFASAEDNPFVCEECRLARAAHLYGPVYESFAPRAKPEEIPDQGKEVEKPPPRDKRQNPQPGDEFQFESLGKTLHLRITKVNPGDANGEEIEGWLEYRSKENESRRPYSCSLQQFKETWR